MPESDTVTGQAGGLLIWFSILFATAGFAFHLIWVFAACAVGLGALLLWLDPGAQPERIVTVGDLARSVAAMNLAKLAEQGSAVTEHDVRNVVIGVLADLSGRSPVEITPDMRFGEAP